MLRGLLRAGLAAAIIAFATATFTTAAVATAAVTTTAVTTTAFTRVARADAGPHVSGTGELGLALRSQPSVDSTRLATIPEGEAVAIVCQTTGADVFGSPIWDRLESGGYVSDWYVDTAGSALAACPSPQAPTAPAYDGAGAARWAVAHAFDPPEYEGADCANFVSDALHFGGGLEATDWWRPYSSSWIVADELAGAMAEHGYLSRTDIDPSDSAIPGAALGDVVLYDTGDGGGFHHVSIVVRIGPSGVVEVASHTNAYDYRIWNQSWLDRADRTGYRAQLLHPLDPDPA